MFGRHDSSLRELLSTQHQEVMTRHQETMAYLRQRELEMREAFQQRKEEFERLMEASERRTEETREFNREILLRNEKVYMSAIVQLEENTEQTRANTRAVLSVLDRLGDAA